MIATELRDFSGKKKRGVQTGGGRFGTCRQTDSGKKERKKKETETQREIKQNDGVTMSHILPAPHFHRTIFVLARSRNGLILCLTHSPPSKISA